MKATHPGKLNPPKPRFAVGAALLTALAMLVTGCSVDVGNPSRVLQSVNVALAPDGAITRVSGAAVSLDESTGESWTTETDFTPADVVADLPVRVSTQYRTDEATGPDLNDLSGFTGRVEIDITVENLTVVATQLTYDAAGQSRTAPALVGTPLSIAASTALPDTPASRLVLDHGGASQSGTNGIVSSTTEGDGIVQWAALLAPPQTGATTVFRLVADVEDFTVPVIDIAVQAGLNTDLSFDGVVSSAFDAEPTSELALQQRTIELVAEVNSVLARAGATITEVRKNLDETSRTLGVSTAQDLQRSSESLASSMKGLSSELAGLSDDLGSTVTGTNELANQQLVQIVDSMNAMLGDTSATLPDDVGLVEGSGCATQVVTPEPGDPQAETTLFASVLQLSAQLDGYAEASTACRDEIVQELAASVGPAEPSPEICEHDSSMTCALLGAQTNVLGALDQLVTSGQDLVNELDVSSVHDAISQYGLLTSDLADIKTAIGTLSVPDGQESLNGQLTDLQASLTDASASLASIQDINSTATAARASLAGGPGSVQAQHDALAQEICSLVYSGVHPMRVEQIRALVTDTPCDGSLPTHPSPTALQNQLTEQQAYWQQVIDATDSGQPGSVLAEVDALLKSISDDLQPVITGTGEVDTTSQDLTALIAAAEDHSAQLDTLLGQVDAEQLALATAISESIVDVADAAKADTQANTDTQIRVVVDKANQGRDSLIESYNRTIAGLTATSDGAVGQSKNQIDAQNAELGADNDAVAAALDDQTAQVLERIAQGTDGSTRDLEAAEALLSDSLNKVILDLGDPQVDGSGLLGSMAASAAKADTADYQLALASQNAAGYANIRAEDIAGILLRQAQFQAALEQAETFPAFHIDVPSGANWQTIYSFQVGVQQ